MIAAALVALGTTLGILLRPWRTPDFVWPLAGSALCLLLDLIAPGQAWEALVAGSDVYCFLLGILAISAFARHERLFDALAHRLLALCGASQARIFSALFAACVFVTVIFSNDATIVIATPAALAVLRRINADRWPYLLTCVFVANAASFVLPISNPANLVLFGGKLPGAVAWLTAYALPSIVALAVTYALLRLLLRQPLSLPVTVRDAVDSYRGTRFSLAIIAVAAYGAGLLVATALHLPIGYVSAALALCTIGLFCVRWNVAKDVASNLNWGIVPLVAGLFVIVAALSQTGMLAAAAQTAQAWATHGAWGVAAVGAALTAATNLVNNLPVGVAAGTAFAHVGDGALRRAVTISIDLGPNVSVTGSLATLLWMDLLQREGIRPSPWRFLLFGLGIGVPSIAAALLVNFL